MAIDETFVGVASAGACAHKPAEDDELYHRQGDLKGVDRDEGVSDGWDAGSLYEDSDHDESNGGYNEGKEWSKNETQSTAAVDRIVFILVETYVEDQEQAIANRDYQ